MRKLLLCFLCAAALCLIPAANAAAGAAPYYPEFTKNGDFPENAPRAVLISSFEEMCAFSDSEIYSRFDKKFFENNNLIIALLERGSGSISFALTGVWQEGDTLTVEVARHSPPMQTMDYRTHVLTLPIAKEGFSATKINLIIN